MIKLIFKIVFLGLFFGFISSISTMILGLIVYYVAFSIDIYLSQTFLRYAAVISVSIGLCCAFSWYGYILFIIHQYIKHLINNSLQTKDNN
mgnify:CR=1 FL=1